MTDERIYVVSGMSCGHCELSVREEVGEIPGVVSVEADHASGRLVVRGEGFGDSAVRDAVGAAGYEIAA